MKNIFLIGFMGCGKTTAGKEVADRLNMKHIDLDSFIEKEHNKSIADLFSENGEKVFREIEHAALKKVAYSKQSLISTGGGTPCFFDNMDIMNRTGCTIYLKTSVEELTRRLYNNNEKRPLLAKKNHDELYSYISQTLKKRENFYNQAKIIIDANDYNTVVSRIVAISDNL